MPSTTLEEHFEKIFERNEEVMELLSKLLAIELSTEMRRRVLRRIRRNTPKVSGELRNSWTVRRRNVLASTSGSSKGSTSVRFDVANSAYHATLFRPLKPGGQRYRAQNRKYATQPRDTLRTAWDEVGPESQNRAFHRAVQRLIYLT